MAGYGVSVTSTLADALAAKGATATVRQTGTSPTDAQIADAVSAANAATPWSSRR